MPYRLGKRPYGADIVSADVPLCQVQNGRRSGTATTAPVAGADRGGASGIQ